MPRDQTGIGWQGTAIQICYVPRRMARRFLSYFEYSSTLIGRCRQPQILLFVRGANRPVFGIVQKKICTTPAQVKISYFHGVDSATYGRPIILAGEGVAIERSKSYQRSAANLLARVREALPNWGYKWGCSRKFRNFILYFLVFNVDISVRAGRFPSEAL